MLTWIKNLWNRPSKEDLFSKVLGHKLIAKELLKGHWLVCSSKHCYLYCIDVHKQVVHWHMNYRKGTEHRIIVRYDFPLAFLLTDINNAMFLTDNKLPRKKLQWLLDALECQK